MFKKIADKITQCPPWWKKDPRFWRLELYDRLLDGTFYDHLPHAFYDETDGSMAGGQEQLIPLEDRRPSRQLNLAAGVARKTARKLWSGRHAPRIHHPDDDVKKAVRALVRRSRLFRQMLEVTFRGSVGSVALTFDVGGDRAAPYVTTQIWHAKHCVPAFDAAGELANLRVQYTTSGADLRMLGEGAGDLEPGKLYWYICEYNKTGKIMLRPVPREDWNPVDGFTSEEARERGFSPWEEQSAAHDYGFVLGHWFRNLSGGKFPDGCATWGEAVNNWIDLDYTNSQLGRGVRYNAAPQLVTIGAPENAAGGVMRGPVTHLQMPQAVKDQDSDVTVGAGDAKLLEMTGEGINAGLKDIDGVRKMALEQISVSRKDPDTMKGPLSGRAMEYLDDDWDDLVMELRSAYGEDGFLPLLKRVVAAVGLYMRLNADLKADLLSLRWPRLFQPTPADIGQIIPALVQAVNPLAVSPQGAGEGRPGMMPPDEFKLITEKEARAWLADNMDIKLLEDEEEEEEPEEMPDRAPDTPPVPAPSPDGGGGDADDQTSPGTEAAAAGSPLAVSTAGGAAILETGVTQR